MLLTFASYVACFVIPLFVGAVTLVPFRYHFYFSVFVHWLIFSLIVIYIGQEYGYIQVMGGIGGVMLGMIMVVPSLFISLWATVCLLASLNREKDALNCLVLCSTFFAMGYSSFWLGMSVVMHFRILDDVLSKDDWPSLIYPCLLTVSPALVAILRRLFQSKADLTSRKSQINQPNQNEELCTEKQ